MRFSTAWAKTAAQNVTLKIATVILAIVSTVQLLIIGNLASRDLPVIERSCYSSSLQAKASAPTNDEMKAFLLESIPMRFNTDAYVKNGFLSIQETTSRENEQASLKQRQINQKVIVANFKFDADDISITTDRIVSVGRVKSVLGLNLKVVLQKTNRSEANPYGLILSSVAEVKEKEEK